MKVERKLTESVELQNYGEDQKETTEQKSEDGTDESELKPEASEKPMTPTMTADTTFTTERDETFAESVSEVPPEEEEVIAEDEIHEESFEMVEKSACMYPSDSSEDISEYETATESAEQFSDAEEAAVAEVVSEEKEETESKVAHSESGAISLKQIHTTSSANSLSSQKIDETLSKVESTAPWENDLTQLTDVTDEGKYSLNQQKEPSENLNESFISTESKDFESVSSNIEIIAGDDAEKSSDESSLSDSVTEKEDTEEIKSIELEQKVEETDYSQETEAEEVEEKEKSLVVEEEVGEPVLQEPVNQEPESGIFPATQLETEPEPEPDDVDLIHVGAKPPIQRHVKKPSSSNIELFVDTPRSGYSVMTTSSNTSQAGGAARSTEQLENEFSNILQSVDFNLGKINSSDSESHLVGPETATDAGPGQSQSQGGQSSDDEKISWKTFLLENQIDFQDDKKPGSEKTEDSESEIEESVASIALQIQPQASFHQEPQMEVTNHPEELPLPEPFKPKKKKKGFRIQLRTDKAGKLKAAKSQFKSLPDKFETASRDESKSASANSLNIEASREPTVDPSGAQKKPKKSFKKRFLSFLLPRKKKNKDVEKPYSTLDNPRTKFRSEGNLAYDGNFTLSSKSISRASSDQFVVERPPFKAGIAVLHTNLNDDLKPSSSEESVSRPKMQPSASKASVETLEQASETTSKLNDLNISNKLEETLEISETMEPTLESGINHFENDEIKNSEEILEVSQEAKEQVEVDTNFDDKTDLFKSQLSIPVITVTPDDTQVSINLDQSGSFDEVEGSDFGSTIEGLKKAEVASDDSSDVDSSSANESEDTPNSVLETSKNPKLFPIVDTEVQIFEAGKVATENHSGSTTDIESDEQVEYGGKVRKENLEESQLEEKNSTKSKSNESSTSDSSLHSSDKNFEIENFDETLNSERNVEHYTFSERYENSETEIELHLTDLKSSADQQLSECPDDVEIGKSDDQIIIPEQFVDVFAENVEEQQDWDTVQQYLGSPDPDLMIPAKEFQRDNYRHTLEDEISAIQFEDDADDSFPFSYDKLIELEKLSPRSSINDRTVTEEEPNVLETSNSRVESKASIEVVHDDLKNDQSEGSLEGTSSEDISRSNSIKVHQPGSLDLVQNIEDDEFEEACLAQQITEETELQTVFPSDLMETFSQETMETSEITENSTDEQDPVMNYLSEEDAISDETLSQSPEDEKKQENDEREKGKEELELKQEKEEKEEEEEESEKEDEAEDEKSKQYVSDSDDNISSENNAKETSSLKKASLASTDESSAVTTSSSKTVEMSQSEGHPKTILVNGHMNGESHDALSNDVNDRKVEEEKLEDVSEIVVEAIVGFADDQKGESDTPIPPMKTKHFQSNASSEPKPWNRHFSSKGNVPCEESNVFENNSNLEPEIFENQKDENILQSVPFSNGFYPQNDLKNEEDYEEYREVRILDPNYAEKRHESYPDSEKEDSDSKNGDDKPVDSDSSNDSSSSEDSPPSCCSSFAMSHSFDGSQDFSDYENRINAQEIQKEEKLKHRQLSATSLDDSILEYSDFEAECARVEETRNLDTNSLDKNDVSQFTLSNSISYRLSKKL